MTVYDPNGRELVSTDLIKIAGTAVAAGAGANTAGTQRVVLSTTQPTLTVTVGTSALPSGAATSAKQDTAQTSLTAIEGYLDGVETKLDTANTSLSVLDDWDESDRAKVNPIVGQAGVAAGAGAVSALTQRVVLALTQPTLTVGGTITEANSAAIAASLSVLDDWDETNRAAVNPIAGQVGVQGAAGAVTALTQRMVLATTQPTLTVAGTITEANSAAVAASLSVMDDWDETNRAAVNTIAGQVGVAGGAGAVSALTQRVVLATTQPTLTIIAAGDVASDSGDSGNPVKIGFIAKAADITAVTANDRVNGVADLVGKQVVMPYAINDYFVAGKTADITGTATTSVISSAGAGRRNYVTQILVTNSHATVGTFVDIMDGTSAIYTGYAAPVGGGFSVSFPVPLRGTAATAINAKCATSGANVRVSASGYTAP